MYAICHTKSSDVLAAVKEMVKKGHNFPICQVGQKLYRRLEANQRRVVPYVTSKKRLFVINKKTLALHKEGCVHAARSNKACIIGAYLVRPKDTGLTTCKTCM